MRYRLSEIKIDPKKVAAYGGGISQTALAGELKDAIISELEKKYGKHFDISEIEVVRESVDARKKPLVKLVYTADFECEEKLGLPHPEKEEYQTHEASVTPQTPRPVIAGFGPCGIFAALILAEAGLRPIVIERGKAVEERVADVEAFWRAADSGNTQASPDPESNVQFGEGGAGTFSDGKLTTGIKDTRIRKVLEAFVEAGAEPGILTKNKPHIGTDNLRRIVKNLRIKIEKMGGEVRFGSRFEGTMVSGDSITGVRVGNAETGNTETIKTNALVMAIGHSARDTFEMLYESGFDMAPKAFSIGVRVQHPQLMINRAQYGDETLADILGPADYKMSYRCSSSREDTAGRGVYTFCMCPGGHVINASTEAETSVTNGMSNSARDGKYANSAVLVDVRTSDFAEAGGNPLAGLKFQQKYERLAWENRTEKGMSTCSFGEFRDISKKGKGAAVRSSMPGFATAAILEAMPVFGRRIKDFDSENTLVTAVETRSSSPVRILRNPQMEAAISGRTIRGIIPAGEGPGYAGGIMSAAVDGIKAAEAIIALNQGNI